MENVLSASNASGQRESVVIRGLVSSPGMQTWFSLKGRIRCRILTMTECLWAERGIPSGPALDVTAGEVPYLTAFHGEGVGKVTAMWATDKGHKICLFRETGAAKHCCETQGRCLFAANYCSIQTMNLSCSTDV